MSDAHVFADRDDAAERYLLGQMSESDRDTYERHFFECVECAEDVKSTAQFIDTCRSVLADRARADAAPPRPTRPVWLSRPAAAVFTGALAATLAIIAYQNVVTIPGLARATAARAVTAVSLAAANARGTSQTIAVPRQQPFVIFVDIPPGAYDSYDGAIVAGNGQAILTVPISSQQARDAVPLLIPAGRLSPGDYTLLVTGRPRAGDAPVEVARLSFTLRFAD